MPIRITRVYTRSGDDGTTSLVGGRRVTKDAARIEAYGTIDELNCVLGLAREFNRHSAAPVPVRDRLDLVLRRLQNELFDLGSELATPPDALRPESFRVTKEHVTALERDLDDCQRDLQPLSSFVLPGGGTVGAFLHLARAVCRRAERRILRLSREEPVNEHLMAYLNRLSDLLFVLSRWSARHAGEEELLWERPLRSAQERRRQDDRKKGD